MVITVSTATKNASEHGSLAFVNYALVTRHGIVRRLPARVRPVAVHVVPVRTSAIVDVVPVRTRVERVDFESICRLELVRSNEPEANNSYKARRNRQDRAGQKAKHEETAAANQQWQTEGPAQNFAEHGTPPVSHAKRFEGHFTPPRGKLP